MNELLLEFNQQHGCWRLVTGNLAQIDVLISFTVSVDGANGPTCRPTFISNSSANSKGGAVLKVDELWHPFASGAQCSGVFVRNNIELGSNSSSCRAMLLTGPNMGGKSTLLRATCIMVIMAQVAISCLGKCYKFSDLQINFSLSASLVHALIVNLTYTCDCTDGLLCACRVMYIITRGYNFYSAWCK